MNSILYLVACPFINFSMHSVVQLMKECRISCMTRVCCAYIVQNLLVATSTASVKVLIGPAACYAWIHALAESVCHNCVLGRCANLCFIIVLHLPSLFFWENLVLAKLLN